MRPESGPGLWEVIVISLTSSLMGVAVMAIIHIRSEAEIRAKLARLTPVVVLDVASPMSVAGGNKDEALRLLEEMRRKAGKLAARGAIVIDSRVVYAAPDEVKIKANTE